MLDDVPVQRSLVRRPQGPRGAQRVQPRAPQGLVGVDVADAGDERLVDEQRLEPRPAAADAGPELAQREPRVQRLRPDAVERVVVRAVQPDPPELADVAEPELAAVVERQREPLVRVGRQRRGHHEQLAGHLEVDGQEGAAGEVEDQLLAAPPDLLDPPARDPAANRAGSSSRRVRVHPTRAPVIIGPGPPSAASRWRRRSRATVSTSGSSGTGPRPRSPRAPRRPRPAPRHAARPASCPPTSRRP